MKRFGETPAGVMVFTLQEQKKKKNGAPASKVQYLKGKRLHVEVINHCTDMESSNMRRTFSVEIFIFYFHYLMIVLLGKKTLNLFFP